MFDWHACWAWSWNNFSDAEQPIFMEMIMGMVTAFVFLVLSLMGFVVLSEMRQYEYKH